MDRKPQTAALSVTFHTSMPDPGSRVDPPAECPITHPNVEIMRLTYADGMVSDVSFAPLSEEIGAICAWHGLKQKLIDAAAISRNPDTGRAATVEEKRTAVTEVWARLCAGEWNKAREGGAGGGLLYRALCRLYEGKRWPEEIKTFLAGKSDAEQSALRRNSRVAAVIEELRAADASRAGIDSEALLGDLDA